MKYLVLFLSLGICTQVMADEHILFNYDEIQLPELSYNEQKPEIVKYDKEEFVEQTEQVEEVKEERNIFVWLFSGTGITLTGILSRIFYVWYQSKRGKLVVKHVKAEAQSLEDSIVEDIEKITDIETSEKAREHLKRIKEKLYKIAKEKCNVKS